MNSTSPRLECTSLEKKLFKAQRSLKVLEISGKGPGGWARTLSRESGPGSAKERRNNEKRNSRPRTEPAWPAGWGEREQELREQLGLNKHTNFDQNTEQEITAQMEELQQARSNALWGCCRNIAAGRPPQQRRR